MNLVHSNTKPSTVESLQGSTLVNTHIREVQLEDSIQYTYKQSKIQLHASTEDVVKQVESMYLSSIDELNQKCAGSLRSKLLGTQIDYDDALLIDTETDCIALYQEMLSVIESLEVE